MDIDLESIPNQVGTAILSAVDGKILKSTGSLDNEEEGHAICATVFKMLLDSGICLGDEPLRRLSISFTDYNYVVTLGKSHVYIVKTEL